MITTGLQNIEFEQAILGVCMLEKSGFGRIESMLRSEHFSDIRNRIIFNHIAKLHEKGMNFDVIILKNSLRNEKKLEDAGGALYLAEICNRVANGANLEFHAKALIECYMRRICVEKVQTMLGQWQLDNYEFDPFQSAENLIQLGSDMLANVTSKSTEACDIDEVEKYIQTLTTQSQKIEIGMQDLQEYYTPSLGHLGIIAARPGMGKTAAMTSQIANIILHNEQNEQDKTLVVCFSLEMPKHEIYNRVNSKMTYIYGSKFRDNKLTSDELNVVLTNQARLKGLYVCEDRTMPQRRAKIIEHKQTARRLGYKKIMVFIDYIQIINSDGKKWSRAEELSEIANGLKALAKEQDVHICTLAQIGRSAEARGGDKRPQLNDLKESGALEEAADFITMIYRPDYYGFEVDANGLSNKGRSEFIIAKNRHGVTGNVDMVFEGQYFSFRCNNQTTIGKNVSEQGFPIEEKNYFGDIDPNHGIEDVF